MKKKISIITLLAMLLCMIPSMAFAESIGLNLSWEKSSYSSNIGKTTSMKLSGVENRDELEITAASSNQDVVPDDLLYIVPNGSYADKLNVYYVGIAAGQADITVTIKSKDGREDTTTIGVTVKTTETASNSMGILQVGFGKSCSFTEAAKTSATRCFFEQHPDLKFISYTDTATEHVDVDMDKMAVTGKKEGIDIGFLVGPKKYPNVKFKFNLVCDRPGLYYGGEVGNSSSYGEYIDKPMEWDASKQGKKIQLKAYLTGMQDWTNQAEYVSSNTDVAVPEAPADQYSKQTGVMQVKKNGTVRIDAYKYTQCASQKFGSATIVVTGCEETSDPDSGWVAVPEGEFTGTEENSTKVSLGNHKFEKQSFNDANIEASVSQEVKSGDVKFDIRISTSNAKGYTVSDEMLAEWMAEMLKRTNICDVAEDGATGDVVAAYGDGYTSEPSSWTHDGSGSVNNGSVLTYSITVDKDRLKKGRKYQLVLGSEIKAHVNDIDLRDLKKSNIGESSVTSTIGGKDATFTFLTVSPAKNVVLDQSKLTLKPGGTAVLVATMNEGLTTQYDDSLIWSSSNEAVATVDDNGRVEALSAGSTYITATAVDGRKTAVCRVDVAIDADGFTLSAKKVKLAAGKSKTVKATVTPADTTDKTVTWKTSNNKVATVSPKGKIKAVAPGKTTITAKTANGKTAKVTVRVSPVKTSISVKAGKKSATVKYKKVKGATRYQVYRATSKNGTYKRIVTRNASKSGTYKDTKLKGKKTYWYKVRSYKLVGDDQILSEFSAPKKVTTKR